MSNRTLDHIDERLIMFMRKISYPLARFALFTVFFWFGTLKVLSTSPANPLVENLLHKTLPFIDFQHFIVFFGCFEMAIGIAFLVPGLERLAVALLIPHMATTFMPLIFLPQITWQSFLTPTLEGQYIIKNLVIIALALSLGAHLKPFGTKKIISA